MLYKSSSIPGVCLRVITIVGLLILLPPLHVIGQSCSCGGAPLLGSLDSPATSAGVWRLGMTYQYRSIADVVTGSTDLNDNVRDRSVSSALMEINYGLTDRWTISLLMSLLQQERNSGIASATGEFLRTRGVGDGVLMLKYNLIPMSVYSLRQISIGTGVKIPTGKSSLTSNGALVAADMQPGSGAFDGIIWAYFYQGFKSLSQFGTYTAISYKFSGTNNRFGVGTSGYRFGNEFVATSGMNYRLSLKFELDISGRYRHVTADRFDELELPNSGGDWFDIIPGLTYNLSRKISVRASSELPVYRFLEGTQLTTNYGVMFSLFYSFGKDGNDNEAFKL